MAYTPQTLTDEYTARAYKQYLEVEERIDDILMDAFPKLLRDKRIVLSIESIHSIAENRCIGAEYFPPVYKEAIIALVLDKFRSWKVRFEDVDSGILTFHYDTKQESLLTLFRNIEERFKNMDLRVDEVDDEEERFKNDLRIFDAVEEVEEVEDYHDDIPF